MKAKAVIGSPTAMKVVNIPQIAAAFQCKAAEVVFGLSMKPPLNCTSLMRSRDRCAQTSPSISNFSSVAGKGDPTAWDHCSRGGALLCMGGNPVAPNVEPACAARFYRAVSSDRRERG